MHNIPSADTYGVVLVNARNQVLVLEPAGHFGGNVWTFAKGRPKKGEAPGDTAVRTAIKESGYQVELLELIPKVFHGTTTSSAFFLAGPLGKQGKTTKETSTTRWVDFEEAARLIAQTQNKTGRERDLAVLRAAEDVRSRLPWALRPAVCKEDWDTKAMPSKWSEIALDLWYDDAVMARIRKGYLPTAMEEKWFVWFGGTVLHFHRSWTGICIFQVRFVQDGEGWRAISAKANRSPKQYLESNDEADRRLVADLIEGWLVNDPDGPAPDPSTSAMPLGSNPDLLGSLKARSSERYGDEQQTYYGFEGPFKAEADGKIWLNDVNLLLIILADFLTQEIRYYAFRIANQYDQSPAKWPNIANTASVAGSHTRWARLNQFLTIFSGRDTRFAYDDNFLSGGGLERRLIEFFGSANYDPRKDARATRWHYPIDVKDPLAAPANMRLLNMWLYSWDADYYGMAASALCGDIIQVLSGNPIALNDPTDRTPYSYGKLFAEAGTLSARFHEVLCEWVEVFAGLGTLNLKDTVEPSMKDAQLYFAILCRYPEELSNGNLAVVEIPEPELWRSLEEVERG